MKTFGFPDKLHTFFKNRSVDIGWAIFMPDYGQRRVSHRLKSICMKKVNEFVRKGKEDEMNLSF